MVGVVCVRSWLLLIGLAVASAACEVPPEEKARQACTVLCGCTEAPLPAVQDRCIAGCISDPEFDALSDECIACVTANSDRCSTLETVCNQACEGPSPTDDDGGIGL